MAFINLGIAGLDVIEQIGKGGSSRVYLARQRDLDREVAVKVMNVGDDPDVLRRFDRERRAMGRLSLNSGIVPVYSSGLTTGDEPYLVMPYYPRGSLADRMADGPVHWREAVDHLIEVAHTMAAAHEADVVHLDLKPGNILLSSDGTPRIADFGIAKLISDQTVSRTGGASFTPAYSAPETLLGGEVSAAADVYGLGATLWALLAGQPPFRSETGENSLMAVIGRVVHEPPGDVRHLAPEAVCAVIETAMAKDPAHRHPTAGAFALALVAARKADDGTTGPLADHLGRFPAPLPDPVTGAGLHHSDDLIGAGAGLQGPATTRLAFDLSYPAPARFGGEPRGGDDGPLHDHEPTGPHSRRPSSLRFDEPVPPRFVPAVTPSGVDDALHRYGPAAAFACSVLVFLGAVVYVAGTNGGETGTGSGMTAVRTVTEEELADANTDLHDDASGRDAVGPAGPSTSDPSMVSATGTAPPSLADRTPGSGRSDPAPAPGTHAPGTFPSQGVGDRVTTVPPPSSASTTVPPDTTVGTTTAPTSSQPSTTTTTTTTTTTEDSTTTTSSDTTSTVSSEPSPPPDSDGPTSGVVDGGVEVIQPPGEPS